MGQHPEFIWRIGGRFTNFVRLGKCIEGKWEDNSGGKSPESIYTVNLPTYSLQSSISLTILRGIGLRVDITNVKFKVGKKVHLCPISMHHVYTCSDWPWVSYIWGTATAWQLVETLNQICKFDTRSIKACTLSSMWPFSLGKWIMVFYLLGFARLCWKEILGSCNSSFLKFFWSSISVSLLLIFSCGWVKFCLLQ